MAQNHIIDETEKPMTTYGTVQGPSRRYRRLRHPSFTAAVWAANNPLLQRGEIGCETDTHKIKVGDGTTYWNDLAYTFDDVGANTDLSNLTNTGKANVAAQGTYSAGTTYASGTVGAAISSKADASSLATVATTGKFSDLNNIPTTLSGYGITDGANTDLNNLTDMGKNITNWSSNVSNCIVEIPQDIDVSFSGAVLTIKSGSKLHYPNGSGVFSTLTLTEDETHTIGANGIFYIFRRCGEGLSGYYGEVLANIGSGTPDSGTNGVFYDTTANRIDYYTSGARGDRFFSFPVCKITVANNVITSIDQVFNGFGFVGGVIYALPGVKGLAPDGRNADGSLKSSVTTLSSVATVGSYNSPYVMSGSGISPASYTNYAEQETRPSFSNGVWYQPSTNIMYSISSGNISVTNQLYALDVISSGGKASEVTPKQVFRAVDYSDTNYIAHQGKPSKKYISLTWGASGTTYTMPADGYLIGRRNSDASGQYLFVYKENSSYALYGDWSSGASQGMCFCVPVSKGDNILINYTAANSITLAFCYANGSK